MAEAVISRSVTEDEVAAAIRSEMGDGVEVNREGPSISVRRGYWTRANVAVRPSGDTTLVQVTGGVPPALLLALVMKVVNSRSFAPEVAGAVERGLSS